MNAKRAKFVKDVGEKFVGRAELYRLDPPIKINDWAGNETGTAEYVIVSAVIAPFTGPETYIFPANEEGEVVSWDELDGSFRGALDIPGALGNAGYTID